MTLAELAEQAGVAPRQIRFLIAEGILPPAAKTGRAADAYGEAHLAKARRYQTLHGLGMKPAAVKVLMAFDDAIPIHQAGGVELRVDPSLDPGALDVEAALADIEQALRAYAGKRKRP